MAPKVDILTSSNLEKLIAGEQALIMKSTIDQKAAEVEELKNKLRLSEERIKNMQKFIDTNIEKQKDAQCSDLIAGVIGRLDCTGGKNLFFPRYI